MNPCDTPACPNEAASSSDGALCDACRERKRTEARAHDMARRCVFLVQGEDSWAATYAHPEGRQRWIDSQWPSYVRHWHRAIWEYVDRPEKEARRAAASAYQRLLASHRKVAAYVGWECRKGHTCHVQTRYLDMELGDGGLVRHLSVPTCDRQESCRDYQGTVDVLTRLVTSKGAEA